MQKIFIARPIFPDVVERLRQYFQVDWNEGAALGPDALTRRLADKDGALTAGDLVNASTLAAAPLLDVPNIVLTPHIASASEATRHAMADLAADTLIAGLGMGPRAGRPFNPINPQVPGKTRS